MWIGANREVEEEQFERRVELDAYVGTLPLVVDGKASVGILLDGRQPREIEIHGVDQLSRLFGLKALYPIAVGLVDGIGEPFLHQLFIFGFIQSVVDPVALAVVVAVDHFVTFQLSNGCALDVLAERLAVLLVDLLPVQQRGALDFDVDFADEVAQGLVAGHLLEILFGS